MKTRFKAALAKYMGNDAGLLRLLIWVYYVPLWVWGIYGTFFAGPPTFVKPVMGQWTYDAWIWLHLIATTTVMAGLRLEDNCERLGGRSKPIGLAMQAGGHACMFWVLLSYEFSAVWISRWGQGTYSVFVIAPYVVGCFTLTIETVAKAVMGRSKP